MTTWELLLIAIALSMDAFAVSVCKGLAMGTLTKRACVAIGLWFGGFQALMPLLGFFLGSYIGVYIVAVDHWIAFALLGIIGLNMIKESLGGEEKGNASIGISAMLPLAVATSIDAFAVGITFALLPSVNIYYAVSLIGITTFALSAVGVWVGYAFGGKQSARAERLGGGILICMGLKILLDHLGVFRF